MNLPGENRKEPDIIENLEQKELSSLLVNIENEDGIDNLVNFFKERFPEVLKTEESLDRLRTCVSLAQNNIDYNELDLSSVASFYTHHNFVLFIAIRAIVQLSGVEDSTAQTITILDEFLPEADLTQKEYCFFSRLAEGNPIAILANNPTSSLSFRDKNPERKELFMKTAKWFKSLRIDLKLDRMTELLELVNILCSVQEFTDDGYVLFDQKNSDRGGSFIISKSNKLRIRQSASIFAYREHKIKEVLELVVMSEDRPDQELLGKRFLEEQRNILDGYKEDLIDQKEIVREFLSRFSQNPEKHVTDGEFIQHDKLEYNKHYGSEYPSIETPITNLEEFIEQLTNPTEELKETILSALFFKCPVQYINYFNIDSDELANNHISHTVTKKGEDRILRIETIEHKEKLVSYMMHTYGRDFLASHWNKDKLTASLIPDTVPKIFKPVSLTELSLSKLKETVLSSQQRTKNLFESAKNRNQKSIPAYRFIIASHENMKNYDGVGICFTQSQSYLCKSYGTNDQEKKAYLSLSCELPLNSIDFKKTWWKSVWPICYELEIVLKEGYLFDVNGYVLWNQMQLKNDFFDEFLQHRESLGHHLSVDSGKSYDIAFTKEHRPGIYDYKFIHEARYKMPLYEYVSCNETLYS